MFPNVSHMSQLRQEHFFLRKHLFTYILVGLNIFEPPLSLFRLQFKPNPLPEPVVPCIGPSAERHRVCVQLRLLQHEHHLEPASQACSVHVRGSRYSFTLFRKNCPNALCVNLWIPKRGNYEENKEEILCLFRSPECHHPLYSCWSSDSVVFPHSCTEVDRLS